MALSEVADLYIILRAITKPFSDAMAKAGVEGEATAGKLSSSFSKAAPIMMGVAGAATLAIGMSVKWASNFETQYTRLFTAAGAAKDQVLASRDAMLKLGDATGFTGTQIAEALYHPVSAGLDLKTSLEVVKFAAEEARISGANLDDTTYSLSSVMKAFNIQAAGAGNTMAELNAIVGDGDMRFQDFNTSIKNWAPTAAAMGISIQSMGSGLAYLTDRGNTAEEASTRMTMGLTLMATPSAQAAKLLTGLGVASTDVKAGTEAMTEVLKKAHVTQNDLAKDLQKPDGIYVALTHLKTALKDAGVSGTEADSTLSKIFGGGRSDKAILSLMQNLEGLRQKYQQIGQDSSAKKFQQNWEDAQKTTAVQFDKLKAQVINLGIQLGEVLLPPLKKVMGFITDGITWITKHKEAMYALAGVITGILVGALYAMASAFVAVVIAAGPITAIVAAVGLAAVEILTHWKEVKKWFEELSGWFQKQPMIIKAALIMLLGPIGEIGAAAFEIYKHWKDIWKFLQELGKDFVQWGKDIAKFFQHVWDDLKTWFKAAWILATEDVKGVWKTLKDAWQETLHFFERAWNDTGGKLVHEMAKDWKSSTEAVSKEWQRISDDLSSIWGSLTTIWDHTGGKLVHWISDAFEWVSKEIHKHWDGIKSYLEGIWQYITGTIHGALQVVTGVLRAAWDLVRGATKMAWDLVYGIIRAAWDLIHGLVVGALDVMEGILQGAWDFIKGAVQVVWDLITGVINTALDFIRDNLKLFADLFSGHWSKLWGDIKKIFSDMWDNITKLFGKVLGDIFKTVTKVTKDIWDGFTKGIENSLTGIGNALSDVWTAIVNFFKDAIHWLFQAGKDLIQGLINGVGSMVSTAVDTVSNLGSKILGGIGGALGINSPSKKFHEIGQYIGQGLVNGINSQSNNVKAAMGNMAGLITDTGMGIQGGVGAFQVTSRGAASPGVINIIVQGSVLNDRDLRDVVQEQMLQLGARYSTSYTPYKR